MTVIRTTDLGAETSGVPGTRVAARKLGTGLSTSPLGFLPCLLYWTLLFGLAPVCNSAGLAARDGIINSGPLYTDSFNSANPTQSMNGQYYPTRASTNGDVLCIAGLAGLPNDEISGRLLLGPSASYDLGTRGLVSGGVVQGLNLAVSDFQVPQTTWLPAITENTLIDGISYQYVFGSGNYIVNNLRGSVYVGTNSHVKLLVSGYSAAFSTIRVAGSGSAAGQLTIYTDAFSSTVSGAVVVDGGDPARLLYYGTINNTNLTFTSRTNAVGAFFAPHAYVRWVNGSRAINDFIGLIEAQVIRVDGPFSLHFDEHLWSLGYSLPDLLTQPEGQSILTGQNVSLSVQARGQVAYQWQKNGTNLNGATASGLSMATVSLSDAGSYTVTITNQFGSLQSSAAVLTVIDPNLVDTDGDGMPDVWEVANGLNPNDPSDALADADQDGLANFLEYALGSDPRNPADAYALWNDTRDPGDVCSNVVVWVSHSGTNHCLAMRYKARVDAALRQLQYVPEVSADNLIWYSDTNNVVSLSVGPADADFSWVTVRDATPNTPAQPRFMRLRVISTKSVTEVKSSAGDVAMRPPARAQTTNDRQ